MGIARNLARVIADNSGAIAAGNLGNAIYGGAIVQSKQYVFRTPITISSGSQNTWVNTGMLPQITPSSANNFIKVHCVMPIGAQHSVQINSAIRMQRKIGAGSFSNPSHLLSSNTALNNRALGQILSLWGEGSNWSNNHIFTFSFIDNPSTTSVVTYGIDFWFGNGTGSFFLGYNFDLSTNDGSFALTPAAFWIIEEIANPSGSIPVNYTS